MTARGNRQPRERLADIVTAVARIKQAEQRLVVAEQANNEVSVQVAFDAILYNLVVIGEAVNACQPS